MEVGKRGLSPVIASVLMILLVLVLVSVVFAWSRGFIEDKGNDATTDISASKLCKAMDFDVVVVGNTGDSYNFEIINRGDINISSLRFRIFPGGNSNIVEKNVEVLSGGAVVDSVTLTGIIDKVEALAVLDKKTVGASRDIICSKNPTPVTGGHW